MATDWDQLRGPLPQRRMSARSTAALLDNPGCVRRAVIDGAQIDAAALAGALGLPDAFGQSPFTLGQGNRFEARVKADGYAELVRVLAELGIVLPSPLTSTAIDARLGNAARVARTRDLLRAIADGDRTAPNVIDRGMTRLSIGDVAVHLEQDALAFRHGGRLHICEIKSFPLVDGTAEPAKVGAAVRQSAVYLASVQDTLAELGLDPGVVSPEVVLICPRNYTSTPTARKIDVTRELRALRRQLARRDRIEDLIATLDLSSLPPVPAGLPEEGEELEAARTEHGRALIAAVPYRYQPSCIGSCDLARVCRSEARATDSPCSLGDEAANLLAATPTLTEARKLADGADRPDPANADVAVALRRARRAQEALSPVAPARVAVASPDDDWPF